MTVNDKKIGEKYHGKQIPWKVDFDIQEYDLNVIKNLPGARFIVPTIDRQKEAIRWLLLKLDR